MDNRTPPSTFMEPNQQPDSHANPDGVAPHDSASFSTVPKDSENFRIARNDSERVRNVPQSSERKENHTLTVRETARMFQAAGVARTERSIINWCQPNAQGVARLHAYFDPNERKYFITPQSVELAIAEEKAKAAKKIESSEPVRTVPNESERSQESREAGSETGTGRIRELEKEVIDLKITNRGKDFFIERLQEERETHVERLMTLSRKVGELETELRQLSEPPGGLRQVGDGPSSLQP